MAPLSMFQSMRSVKTALTGVIKIAKLVRKTLKDTFLIHNLSLELIDSLILLQEKVSA